MDDFIFEDNAEIPEAEFETKVPADYRGYYAKDGTTGTYKIAEVHAPAAKMIDGLGKNLRATKATNQSVGLESKNRREALEAWQATTGVKTPEEMKAKLDELNGKIAQKAAIDPKEVRDAIAAEYADKFKAAEDENKAMFATLEENLRDKDALAAIAEHKGNQKLLMPLIVAQTKVMKGDDGKYFTAVLKPDGTVRAGSDGGPLPISKLVAEMKEDKDLASAFEGTKQQGGGPDPKNQNRNNQQQQQNNNNNQQQQQREQRGVSKISAGLAAARS